MCPHKVDVNVKFDLSAIQYIAHHRRLAIEECIEALTHSCLCNDAFCRRSTCSKMKRVVIHTSICKRRVKGNCPICKQLIALCCYHAKYCRQELRCTVPFCNTVKAKMRQRNLLFDARLDAARDNLRMQPDPEESDAIDVNMSGSPAFGDDSPSGSGSSGRRSVTRPAPSRASESSDSDDEGPNKEKRSRPNRPLPQDELSSDGEPLQDERPLNVQ